MQVRGGVHGNSLHLLLNCAVNPKLLYHIKYLKKAKMKRVCDTDRD